MVTVLKGTFYDGVEARRREAAVHLGGTALEVIEGERPLAVWPYDEVRLVPGPPGRLRLATFRPPALARLEIPDSEAQAAIRERCRFLDDPARPRGRSLLIVGMSAMAAASILFTATLLVPLASDWLAPRIPSWMEQRLGQAVAPRVRGAFGGSPCTGHAGRSALDKLSRRLVEAAQLGPTIHVEVLPSSVPNAFALPGGRIFVLNGLIHEARSVDEFAGVLAHEMGHVVRRDSLRHLLHSGGTGFLFGLLVGDLTGGGTLILLGRAAFETAYSRQSETAADAFAAKLLLDAGGSPSALGTFLTRLQQSEPRHRLPFLDTHPATTERLAAFSNYRTSAEDGAPLLEESEWEALKRICGES